MVLLKHNNAIVKVEEISSTSRRIQVEMNDSSLFSPRKEWITKYPLDLIEEVLSLKGPAYLCDEIARDEDPDYVESDLLASVFGYVSKSEMDGKIILDFGCGSGASTMILARNLPNSKIYGVELDETLLEIAQKRADHYHFDNLTLLLSPTPDKMPEQIQEVDFILFSAVYEHLLPEERPTLLRQMWQILAPDGIMFINQTPDRRFPIETHTTGLPLINYLPDSVADLLARRLSKRKLRSATWQTLLRKGIRGATPTEILRFLSISPSLPVLLNPKSDSLHQQSDIWYRSARARLAKRYSGFRKKVLLAIMDCIVLSRVPIAPYLSLAVRKQCPYPIASPNEG